MYSQTELLIVQFTNVILIKNTLNGVNLNVFQLGSSDNPKAIRNSCEEIIDLLTSHKFIYNTISCTKKSCVYIQNVEYNIE